MQPASSSTAWSRTATAALPDVTAPTLIFGYGNPSRGDDAIGPELIARLERLLPAHPQWGRVELLTDFQLQVEHAMDLRVRRRVLFVDAALDSDEPYAAAAIRAAPHGEFTTHALSPQGLLHVYRSVFHEEPPASTLLAIRGYAFELGAPLSSQAAANLDAALVWVGHWLGD